jgi:Cd2+/Zn2+-exporting ATPase
MENEKSHRTVERKRFLVSGVCCAAEEQILRKCFDSSVGSDRYTFSLVSSELRIDPAVSNEQVLHDLRRAGFQGRLKQDVRPPQSFLERHGRSLWTALAVVLAAAGMASGAFGWSPLSEKILLGAAIVAGGWQILLKVIAALRARALDMNVLMTLAVIGAVSIGRWNEAAAVIILFSVALMLESYSASRTRRAMESLVAISPQQANVLANGSEHTIPAAEILPDDIMLIRPGERIPTDGVVVEGESDVNEAAITGESVPVGRKIGDTVFAGSLNGVGSLTVQATRRYEDSTLAHIIHLIEEAEQQRAPVQSFVDRFAAVYTPVVVIIAVLVAVIPPLLLAMPFDTWLYRALVLLVIACPCALVISTPVTLVSALTNGARNGILIKGGKHLEDLRSVSAIAFDKTGTLTGGMMSVTDVIPLDNNPQDSIVELAAALELRSEHHLAAALVSESERRGLVPGRLAVDRFKAHPGRGVAATIEGIRFYLGNRELCREQHFLTREVENHLAALNQEGKTTIVLGKTGSSLGIIALRDQLRPQSREVVSILRKQGIRHIVMLSGDNERVAAAMATEAGIEQWVSALLPAGKVEAIEKLKKDYGGVAMVGDGINDAPALAAASVGIAMGAGGSDTALETADIVLMGDNLAKIPHVLGLSRLSMRIIRQNVAIALGLKIIFLALSLTGVATLWMAILADDGASLAVIANGLRALGFRRNNGD